MNDRRRASAVLVLLSGCAAFSALLVAAFERSSLGLAVGLVVVGTFGLSLGRWWRGRPGIVASEGGQGEMTRIGDGPSDGSEACITAPHRDPTRGAQDTTTDTTTGAAHLARASSRAASAGRDEAAPRPPEIALVDGDEARGPPVASIHAEVERVDPTAPLDDLFANSTRTFRALQQRLRGAGVKVSSAALEIDEAGRVRGIAWQASLGAGDGPRMTLPLVSIATLRGRDKDLDRGVVVISCPGLVAHEPGPWAPVTPDPFAVFRGRRLPPSDGDDYDA